MENENLLGGKYRLMEVAGKGGQGSVYRAYDEKLKKFWAVKKIQGAAIGENNAFRSFLAEWDSLQDADRTYFPMMIDWIEDKEDIFLVMDFVEGITLERKLKEEGAFPVEKVLEIGVWLCKALECLHKMQPPVLYLDMKPANVIVSKEGTLRLVDFGSAIRCKQSIGLAYAGSPGYCAPEKEVDERSDIFSLGVTLYELATGEKPEGKGFFSEKRNGRTLVSGKLGRVLKKAAAFEKEKRYQTVQSLRMALESLSSGEKRRKRQAFFWKLSGNVFLLPVAWYFADVWEKLLNKKDIEVWIFSLLAGVFWVIAFLESRYLTRKKRSKKEYFFVQEKSVFRTERSGELYFNLKENVL